MHLNISLKNIKLCYPASVSEYPFNWCSFRSNRQCLRPLFNQKSSSEVSSEGNSIDLRWLPHKAIIALGTKWKPYFPSEMNLHQCWSFEKSLWPQFKLLNALFPLFLWFALILLHNSARKGITRIWAQKWDKFEFSKDIAYCSWYQWYNCR